MGWKEEEVTVNLRLRTGRLAQNSVEHEMAKKDKWYSVKAME